jgi:hypothetical protein
VRGTSELMLVTSKSSSQATCCPFGEIQVSAPPLLMVETSDPSSRRTSVFPKLLSGTATKPDGDGSPNPPDTYCRDPVLTSTTHAPDWP